MRSIIALSLLVGTVLALPMGDFDNVVEQSIENRIVGGNPASFGQFPYQVGIRMEEPLPGIGKMTSWCGGSLIARNLVITAAHCLKGARSLELFLGVTDLSKEEPTRQVLKLSKDHVIIHEHYDGARARNDIALIKLPTNVALNNNVRVIQLPRRSQRSETFENTMSWISGWGMLGHFKLVPSVLQYATRQIISPESCEKVFTVFHKDTQVCLDGSNKISSCSGDLGGPLAVTDKDGSRILVGVTSYQSPKGCEAGFPTVYTRTTAFLDWIAENGGITIRN